MKVLFIGATGFVGSYTVPLLKDKFDLTLMARYSGKVADLPVREIDICDWESIETAIKNGASSNESFDAVVYCATADYHHVNMADAESRHLYYESCIEVNARGAYHVYEAAWRAGVPRVVHIGSLAAMIGEPKYDFIDVHSRDRPHDLYGATKIFGEHVGRQYAFQSAASGQQMKVLCLRLGQPTAANDPHTQRWIHSTKDCGLAADMRDIASAMECALKTDIQYGVYSIVSAANEIFIDPALYIELGYKPMWKYNFTDRGLVEISSSSK